MFATHPKMAKEWATETPDIKHLPERARREAILRALGRGGRHKGGHR